jgi:hypothetical protein
MSSDTTTIILRHGETNFIAVVQCVEEITEQNDLYSIRDTIQQAREGRFFGTVVEGSVDEAFKAAGEIEKKWLEEMSLPTEYGCGLHNISGIDLDSLNHLPDREAEPTSEEWDQLLKANPYPEYGSYWPDDPRNETAQPG